MGDKKKNPKEDKYFLGNVITQNILNEIDMAIFAH